MYIIYMCAIGTLWPALTDMLSLYKYVLIKRPFQTRQIVSIGKNAHLVYPIMLLKKYHYANTWPRQVLLVYSQLPYDEMITQP